MKFAIFWSMDRYRESTFSVDLLVRGDLGENLVQFLFALARLGLVGGRGPD